MGAAGQDLLAEEAKGVLRERDSGLPKFMRYAMWPIPSSASA
jgi:hypothetical protein